MHPSPHNPKPKTPNFKDRYILDAIIGEGLKSTEGGIGVEKLGLLVGKIGFRV